MNVLKISTTPIRLSMSSQRARLESQIPDPEVGIDVTSGKLQMHSENIKVNIDTFEARQNQGFRTARGLMRDAAAAGQQAAQAATAQYARIGNQMSQIQTGATMAEIMKNYTLPGPSFSKVGLAPHVGPDISWQANDLAIDFTPAQVDFQADTAAKPSTYVPGKLEINVEQYPKVDIEYVGDPLYVPPSASPAYEGE